MSALASALKNKVTIELQGNKYEVKEMTLAQKAKLVQPIVSFIKDAVKDITIKKTVNGGIDFVLPEGGIKISDLKVEDILFALIDFMPNILSASVPDFKDWDSLSETETREPLIKVMEVNDFGGFVVNFISFVATPFRSLKH